MDDKSRWKFAILDAAYSRLFSTRASCKINLNRRSEYSRRHSMRRFAPAGLKFVTLAVKMIRVPIRIRSDREVSILRNGLTNK